MSWDRKITVKTIEELAIMRMAGRINAEALDAAYKAIHPGATTADLNAAAEEILKKYGVYSPFKNYTTVSLYPRKGKVKYLKFKTQQELERWPLEEKRSFIVRGCLHIVDGKELVFDITEVESSDTSRR